MARTFTLFLHDGVGGRAPIKPTDDLPDDVLQLMRAAGFTSVAVASQNVLDDMPSRIGPA